ncbi:hypothetical protein XENTR_v10011045 [Xenopus tropicalis]|nr:hypothetical protein XENTR_v10011045 [Xenopus tropicalis]
MPLLLKDTAALIIPVFKRMSAFIIMWNTSMETYLGWTARTVCVGKETLKSPVLPTSAHKRNLPAMKKVSTR